MGVSPPPADALGRSVAALMVSRHASSRREKEDEQGETGSSTGSGAFAANIAAFRASFAELSQASLASAANAIDPGGSQAKLVAAALGPVFEALGRHVNTLAETLSDANVDANRKALKALSATHQLKLTASRTAASVSMEQKAAEMQATFNVQLQQKVETLQCGGSAELKEAQEKAEELQQALDKMSRDLDRSEELSKGLKAMLQAKEVEADAAEKEVVRLEAALEGASAVTQRAAHDSKFDAQKARASLAEAASEAHRAALQTPDKAKKQVAEMAVRLRKEVAAVDRGEGEATEVQLQRLLVQTEEMSKQIADYDEQLASERARAEEQIMAARREAEEARAALRDFKERSRNVGLGSEELRNALDAAQMEAGRLSTELAGAHQLLEDKERALVQTHEDADSIRREMTESLTKTLASAQRAAMQSAEECKRQVHEMANRLRIGLEAAGKGDREQAQTQLERLLGEIGAMSKQIGVLEAKLHDAERAGKGSEALLARLRRLETEDRAAREALARALAEVHIKITHSANMSEQLSRLLAHYESVKVEAQGLKVNLDQALRDMGAIVGENMSLTDKLKQLLDDYRANREESAHLRATLDKALQDIALTVGENANLSDKLRQVLQEYRRMSENERTLRVALKKQHNALHAAYHRVKDVESELQRSHGAASEERETLVSAALHALSSLRMRLGAVHAVRPGETKPVEDALVVKRALHQSSSVGALLPRQQQQQQQFSPLPPASPPAHQATARLEAFVERVADTVGLLSPSLSGSQHTTLPAVSQYWTQATSRPGPHGPRVSRELGSGPRVPQPPRPGSHTRIPQPVAVVVGGHDDDTSSLSPMKQASRLSLMRTLSPAS